ncbi:SIMPL domain-containing protein [Patescibacteria group bacterium]|nr:SIMPL domain-containing protein [Patescibacteria group bacterium]
MNETFFSSPINRILGTLALVGLVVSFAAYAYYTLKQAEYMYMGPTTISVTGEGEVLAVPDVGQFSYTVSASAPDATAAQTEVATKGNAVIAYLKEQGIEDRDIKTQQYSMYPKYRWEERPCVYGVPCMPGQQIEDGFEVSQSVTVKVRNLDTAGNLITGVGEKGATNLSGLTFTVDDEEALKSEARTLAIADAQAQSEQLAKDLGVRIVKMNGYYEEGPMSPLYGYGGEMDAKMQSAMPAVAPELPAGESATKSRVTVTYIVK